MVDDNALGCVQVLLLYRCIKSVRKWGHYTRCTNNHKSMGIVSGCGVMSCAGVGWYKREHRVMVVARTGEMMWWVMRWAKAGGLPSEDGFVDEEHDRSVGDDAHEVGTEAAV